MENLSERGGDNATTSLQLPSFFPIKTKNCRIVSDSFFSCFEAEFTPSADNSSKCQRLLEEYRLCVEKDLKKEGLKIGPKRSYYDYFKSFIY